ncbi:MAG: hypothetical protein ACE5GY_09770 [Thermodesulfobacteriota bacterium]
MRLAVSIAVLISLVAPACCSAKGMKERTYQRHWCARQHGVMEVVLSDRTRVDCVTEDYAVEVDFARKWAEAIGQAVYYAMRTEKRPGILLILEDEKDRRYLERLTAVTDKLGITVWTITPGEIPDE